MAVYKTKTGKWQAVISWRDENDKFHKKKKTFNLKREAQNFEVEFLKEIDSQLDESITFDEVFKEYLDNMRVNSNENSIMEKERITRLFLSDLNGKKMSKITKRDYLTLFQKIATSNYAYSYRKKIITQMKSIAHFAYTFHNIQDNTKTLPPLKKQVSDHVEMHVWDEEEFNKFIEYVDDITFKTFFHTLFYTGLRRGEALALQKSDLKNGQLIISKSIKHAKNGFIPLKTATSRRKIQLDNKTLEMIKYLKDNIEGDFLFGGYEPVGISTIQRNFTKAKQASGVTDIRLHDLRHSHASLLINKGANIVAVSKRLGHANTKTTLEVYTHLLEETQDELVAILNE
ncbi:site-specific integrase [Erysipelothrix urinaevulpis]|uniref:tyrosine-type recombinase/integrase n=1 Tax=Erysipelothrix urinaevulpis TaxID=2683717 RepID=UPI00135891AD|nr:site-specific integrase [Erysipelothrix urinaevulpis]